VVGQADDADAKFANLCLKKLLDLGSLSVTYPMLLAQAGGTPEQPTNDQPSISLAS
jgi:hypothetical protein